MVYGSRGFIAWFYAIIYVNLIKACKKIYVKSILYLIGIILMIVGLFYLITTMPSLTSIIGMYLVFIGLFVFLIPFGANSSG